MPMDGRMDVLIVRWSKTFGENPKLAFNDVFHPQCATEQAVRDDAEIGLR